MKWINIFDMHQKLFRAYAWPSDLSLNSSAAFLKNFDFHVVISAFGISVNHLVSSVNQSRTFWFHLHSVKFRSCLLQIDWQPSLCSRQVSNLNNASRLTTKQIHFCCRIPWQEVSEPCNRKLQQAVVPIVTKTESKPFQFCSVHSDAPF